MLPGRASGNAYDAIHNGMNGGTIIHAQPGTWLGARDGLNLTAGAQVDEYFIASTAFRQWEGPFARAAAGVAGYLQTTSVETNDCFTAVEFNASGIHGTPFNLDGTDELIWAANGEDRYNGYHGRAYRGMMIVNWGSGAQTFVMPPPPSPAPPPPASPHPPSVPPSPPAAPPPPLPGTGMSLPTRTGIIVSCVVGGGLILMVLSVLWTAYRSPKKASARTSSEGDDHAPARAHPASLTDAVHHGFYHLFLGWGTYVARRPCR